MLRPEEASLSRRGIAVSDPAMARRLERMLEAFIAGYNHAIHIDDPQELCDTLHRQFDAHHVGFAFEGIGLYLTALDLLMPGRNTRLAEFVRGPAVEHDYIVAVGAGFAIARVPWGPRAMERYLETLDPLMGWCVPCGFGFHHGFFHHREYLLGAANPPSVLSPLGRQLFDSGLGRSLWWVGCGDPARIRDIIAGFSGPRKAELWAGIGIAASYAGGASNEALQQLLEFSGDYSKDLISGLPFSARLRQKAGNHSPVTDAACQTWMGLSTNQVADLAVVSADAVKHRVTGKGLTNAYDLVRSELVSRVSCKKAVGGI